MQVRRIRVLAGAFVLFMVSATSAVGRAELAPVLTIDEAVALAMKGNRRIQSAGLDLRRAEETTGAARSLRLPRFSLYMLGGASLRSFDFTIPQGVLGIYPGIGPLPGRDSTITNPRSFASLVVGQTTQPVSQLWKIHLGLLESKLGEEFAQENLRKQKQDTAQSVRDTYYRIAQTQAQIESAEAAVKYRADLSAETDRKLLEQAVLKADSLAVKAKLSQQRYRLITLRDSLESLKESLNQLLGRDLNTPFSVEVEPAPAALEIDLAAARDEARSHRVEIRQARLQSKKAEIEIRRQRAEYLPDVSAHFTYLSLPNVSFVPQNVILSGFLLQWQPFDWGQKRRHLESLKYSAKQALLTEQDAEQQVMMDVNAKFRKLAEARVLIDSTALTQESEREKQRVLTNQYNQKAVLLSDVLQQEAAVSQAQTEYQNALALFWSAKTSFDHALGRD